MSRQELIAKINTLRLERKDFEAVKTWRKKSWVDGKCIMSFSEFTKLDPRRELDTEEALIRNRVNDSGRRRGSKRREERMGV